MKGLLGGVILQFTCFPVNGRILGVELLVSTGDVASAGCGEKDSTRDLLR